MSPRDEGRRPTPAGEVQGPTLVIEPAAGWPGVDWRELLQYRDLLRFLVFRTVRGRYSQSVLGIGWAVAQPLISALVFTIVFGRLAQVSSDGAPYGLFSIVGLVPWTYFSGALSDATNSLLANAHMVSKVYFPRMLLPLAAAAAKLVDFGVGLLVALVMVAVARGIPATGLLMLPPLLVIMAAAAAGLGMWLTALAVQYRDVSHASGFLLQLLMYASPVVYPASLVPPAYRSLYALNPMVGVIEGFRAALLGTQAMPWAYIIEGAVVAVVLFVSGARYFRRQERLFADVA